MTAGVGDHELARKAWEYGACDIITAPLVPHDALSSVKVAYQMRDLRRTRDQLRTELEILRDRLPQARHLPPATSRRKTVTPEEQYVSRTATLHACERTIEAIERSLVLLRVGVGDHEYPVAQGVEKRLSLLAKPALIQ